MNRGIVALGAALVALSVPALPASASYMASCKKLIGAWEACRESNQDCKTEHNAIEAECKCHKLKGDTWKLVNAAVGKDDVCQTNWPTTPPPDPSPPRHQPDGGHGGEVRSP